MRAALALLLACAIGCATAPTGPRFDARGARLAAGEPQLDVYVDDGAKPGEPEQAAQRARAALKQALAERNFAAAGHGAPDGVLVVRERAIVRSARHRHAQEVAVAVLVTVGVVAIVGIALLMAKGGGGAGHFGGAAHAAHGLHAAAPAGLHVAHSAVPIPLPVGSVRPVAPVVVVDPVPPIDDALDIALNVHAPGDLPPAVASEDRGFFDGEVTSLELELHDAKTGEVTWSAAIDGEVDPRDPAAVGGLLDAALAHGPPAAAR